MVTIAEKLVTIAEKIQKIYKSGEKKEYNKFWDSYQNNGAVCHGLYMFGGYNWNDDVYDPKYPIKVDAFSSMYQVSRLTDTKTSIDVTYGTGSNLFYNAANMKTIRKIIVNVNNTYNNWFYGCTNLEEIRFEGTIGNSIDLHWSTKLSAESYESILSCLSTTSAGQTLTLPTTAETTYDAKYGSGAWAERIKEVTNWEFKYEYIA